MFTSFAAAAAEAAAAKDAKDAEARRLKNAKKRSKKKSKDEEARQAQEAEAAAAGAKEAELDATLLASDAQRRDAKAARAAYDGSRPPEDVQAKMVEAFILPTERDREISTGEQVMNTRYRVNIAMSMQRYNVVNRAGAMGRLLELEAGTRSRLRELGIEKYAQGPAVEANREAYFLPLIAVLPTTLLFGILEDICKSPEFDDNTVNFFATSVFTRSFASVDARLRANGDVQSQAFSTRYDLLGMYATREFPTVLHLAAATRRWQLLRTIVTDGVSCKPERVRESWMFAGQIHSMRFGDGKTTHEFVEAAQRNDPQLLPGLRVAQDLRMLRTIAQATANRTARLKGMPAPFDD